MSLICVSLSCGCSVRESPWLPTPVELVLVGVATFFSFNSGDFMTGLLFRVGLLDKVGMLGVWLILRGVPGSAPLPPPPPLGG